LAGVLLACVAGLFLGALNITTRRGLARSQDIEAGSAIITLVAFAVVAPFALGSGDAFDVAELWPFLLLGAFVPGLSLLMVVHAVQATGASRAGILFGMAPLFSALFAVIAFGEPFQLALAVGTLLVVAGGVVLALEGERPADYRAYGAVLAVTVAAGFGLRDNIARAVGEDVSVDPLAQSTVVMLGGSLLLVANLLRKPGPFRRLRDAFLPFVWSGVVLAVGQGALFEALDRARVTVVAPLAGTGVLWTVVLSAIFIGRSELIGKRLIVVALLVVAGGTLVGVTR
jgi:drug/metabolite transporter (DMT)-like permease